MKTILVVVAMSVPPLIRLDTRVRTPIYQQSPTRASGVAEMANIRSRSFSIDCRWLSVANARMIADAVNVELLAVLRI
jgi:hypothetical protein